MLAHELYALLCLTCGSAALLSACGDDTGAGAGGATSSSSTGGMASAGGANEGGASTGGGGEGGAASPTGLVEWTFDDAARATSSAQPPTASLEKTASFLILSIAAVDTVASATLNLSLSLSATAGETSIPAGTYACAPSNMLPAVSVSAAEGSIVATSANAGHDCDLVLEEQVVDGGVVRGSLVGNVSDGVTSYPITGSFDLREPPG
jgi:hypothetical protein